MFEIYRIRGRQSKINDRLPKMHHTIKLPFSQPLCKSCYWFYPFVFLRQEIQLQNCKNYPYSFSALYGALILKILFLLIELYSRRLGVRHPFVKERFKYLLIDRLFKLNV